MKVDINDYEEWKSTVTTNNLPYTSYLRGGDLNLIAILGSLFFFHRLDSDNESDYLTNFKPNENAGLGNPKYTNGKLDTNAVVLDNTEEVPGRSAMSSKLKYIQSLTKIDLPKVTENYAEIFNIQDSGRLWKCLVQFNSNDIDVKLTIDGNQVASVNLEDLETLTEDVFKDKPFGFIKTEKNGRYLLLDFGDCPVRYDSSIKLEARADSGSKSKDMLGYMIQLERFNS